MNDNETVHPSGDLTDDDYSIIENHETQHKRTNRNNSLYTLVNNELQSVGIQTVTLWIYYVHPTRKKCAGNRLNFIS